MPRVARAPSLDRRRLLRLAGPAAALAVGALLSGCGAEWRAVETPTAGSLAVASPLPPTRTPAPVAPPTAPSAPSASATPAADPTPAAIPAARATEHALPIPTIGGAFGTPVPAAYDDLMSAVRAYFYFLKRAFVAGNASVLWAHYPDLRRNADAVHGAGVNTEAYWVNLYRPMHPFDGDVSPEAYAPIAVKVAGDRADVAVHGWLSFLVPTYDFSGKERFGSSGMEFRVTLLLQRRQGAWTVVQTDWPPYGDGGWGRR